MSTVIETDLGDDMERLLVRDASFKYDDSINLGDEIQTLAAEQYLPDVDIRIDRDSLTLFKVDEIHIVILQGWFGMNTDHSSPLRRLSCRSSSAFTSQTAWPPPTHALRKLPRISQGA